MNISSKVITWLTYLFWLLPICKNRIVFSSYFGRFYNDSPKAISDILKNTDKQFDLIWLVDSIPLVSDKNIYFVKKHSIKAIYYLSTAKVWVDNCRKSEWIRKRKNQYYIQTWHGSIALKYIEKDAENTLPKQYLKNAIHDSKLIDCMISNGTWCTKLYRNSFWYENEIEEFGTPRLDILFNISSEKKRKIIKHIGLSKDTNIVIYAPTFRNKLSKEVYNLNYLLLRNTLKKKFGGDWVILCRLHPNMSDQTFKSLYSFVYDVTTYSDLYELLAISNILITDYSSTMFEMAYCHKPVFLYCPDFKEYMLERGYYFTFEDLPYPMGRSTEELCEIIYEWNETEYLRKQYEFEKKCGITESGQAAKKVADKIIDIICYTR